jgi:hypothetical protein
LKCEVDRKDELIKTLKEKTEAKIREYEETTLLKEKECEKTKRELELS